MPQALPVGAAFLFWCYAMWKRGSSNCYIFEMTHATGISKSFIHLSMYLVFTTNWGHKNNNYLKIRNNNNNVYTIKKYVPFINCIMEWKLIQRFTFCSSLT